MAPTPRTIRAAILMSIHETACLSAFHFDDFVIVPPEKADTWRKLGGVSYVYVNPRDCAFVFTVAHDHATRFDVTVRERDGGSLRSHLNVHILDVGQTLLGLAQRYWLSDCKITGT